MATTWFIECPRCHMEGDFEIEITHDDYQELVIASSCMYCEEELPESVIAALVDDSDEPDWSIDHDEALD